MTQNIVPLPAAPGSTPIDGGADESTTDAKDPAAFLALLGGCMDGSALAPVPAAVPATPAVEIIDGPQPPAASLPAPRPSAAAELPAQLRTISEHPASQPNLPLDILQNQSDARAPAAPVRIAAAETPQSMRVAPAVAADVTADPAGQLQSAAATPEAPHPPDGPSALRLQAAAAAPEDRPAAPVRDRGPVAARSTPAQTATPAIDAPRTVQPSPGPVGEQVTPANQRPARAEVPQHPARQDAPAPRPGGSVADVADYSPRVEPPGPTRQPPAATRPTAATGAPATDGPRVVNPTDEASTRPWTDAPAAARQVTQRAPADPTAAHSRRDARTATPLPEPRAQAVAARDQTPPPGRPDRQATGPARSDGARAAVPGSEPPTVAEVLRANPAAPESPRGRSTATQSAGAPSSVQPAPAAAPTDSFGAQAAPDAPATGKTSPAPPQGRPAAEMARPTAAPRPASEPSPARAPATDARPLQAGPARETAAREAALRAEAESAPQVRSTTGVEFAGVTEAAADTASPARPAEPTVRLPEAARIRHSELLAGRPQRLTLEIDPPQLGRCELDLSLHDGQVRATVLAERPETVLALRAVEVQLREQLSARDLQITDFDVRQAPQDGSGQQARQGPAGDGRGHQPDRPRSAAAQQFVAPDRAEIRQSTTTRTIDLVA